MKSKSGWGNNYNGTDDFGFSALPGGSRYSDGDLDDAGGNGYWWTATVNGDYLVYNRGMRYDLDNVNEYYGSKADGFSVRCLKD